ncbi:MAG: HU family DNA-binding protein [Bacteroides sp.]
MNERFCIQDLVGLLVGKHDMERKNAENFVKEFFLLIEQALENDRYVKIKGFGTFKLIDVDSRESVNVNSGERFQIQGHTKVSFTPDLVLRDLINKPFAHFETVILNENTVLSDTPIDDLEDEEAAISTSVIEEVLAEDVEDVKLDEDLLKEEVSTEKVVEIEKKAEVESKPELVTESFAESEEEPVDEPSVEPIAESEVIPVAEPIAESEVEVPIDISKEAVSESDRVLTAEEIIMIELRKARPMASSVYKKQEKAPSTPPTEEPQPLKPIELKREKLELEHSKHLKQSNPKRKNFSIFYLITIIVLALLSCGGAILFVYYPDLFSFDNKKEVIQAPVAPPVVQSKITLDTLSLEKDMVEEALSKEMKTIEPVVKTQQPINAERKIVAKPVMPVKVDSAVYKIMGTKATHVMKEGETLTRVSLRYYGTKALWSYIVQHNQSIIKDPNNVPYGTKLNIPELVKK